MFDKVRDMEDAPGSKVGDVDLRVSGHRIIEKAILDRLLTQQALQELSVAEIKKIAYDLAESVVDKVSKIVFDSRVIQGKVVRQRVIRDGDQRTFVSIE